MSQSSNELIQKLKTIIDNSDNIVFFCGAGVSTESGIKDFRSADGLYNEKNEFKYSPETMLSRHFFFQKTSYFYDFYRKKMNALPYKPNATHYKLLELEQSGKLKGVITQNIDGFESSVGIKNVIELHGSIHRNYCIQCGSKGKCFDAHYVFEETHSIPRCPTCNHIIKPDIILYEEQLNQKLMNKAADLIEGADVLIIAGTSLTVYPACLLISSFRGKHLVIINKDSTEHDNLADLVIRDSIGTILSNI